jgi:predicted carbohydrate-binding protein with CBM5 and CBM33 domain
LRYYSINLGDKVSPEIVKWDHDNDISTYDIAKAIAGGDLANPQIYGNDYTVPQNTSGNITIYFSEDINESKLEGTFEVSGFTITNITAPAETKTVILEVKANADNTPVKTTVTQVSEIFDRADNALARGSTWEVMLEAHLTN